MEFEKLETNPERKNEYPKLVRDNIPEMVQKRTGKKAKTRTLENDEEYLQFLLKKIGEEAQELANAKDKEHLAEETADMKELLDAILEANGLTWEKIKKVQEEKAEERGRFKKRILMLEKVD